MRPVFRGAVRIAVKVANDVRAGSPRVQHRRALLEAVFEFDEFVGPEYQFP